MNQCQIINKVPSLSSEERLFFIHDFGRVFLAISGFLGICGEEGLRLVWFAVIVVGFAIIWSYFSTVFILGFDKTFGDGFVSVFLVILVGFLLSVGSENIG